MATKTNVIVTDDIDNTEGASTVRFGFDGKNYEIDLSEKNKDKMLYALGKFIGHARVVPIRPVTANVRSSRGASRPDLAEIRAWAQQNGLSVGDRGRIPAQVITAYVALH